eukprot:CAMPEP_0184686490 /NCGR_PEP_ID=MMETSP0312-20130426/22698_1 /TAXON_ID=31354 /ORGANISM="Compsopogon coeruleus, Strain SAG 36.94" /LENGTH=36 /DNA_ID= /DNA_START= /DNA_END= /DNA_ORIENTATION=
MALRRADLLRFPMGDSGSSEEQNEGNSSGPRQYMGM